MKTLVKFFAAAAGIAGLAACGAPNPNFEIKQISEESNIALCPSDNPHSKEMKDTLSMVYNIDYLEYGNPTICAKINTLIGNTILDSTLANVSVQDAIAMDMDNTINEYQKYLPEAIKNINTKDNELNFGYSAERYKTGYFMPKDTASFKDIDTYMYESYRYEPGAAHGFTKMTATMINMKTGDAVKLQDIFSDYDTTKLAGLVLEELKTKNNPNINFIDESDDECSCCADSTSSTNGYNPENMFLEYFKLTTNAFINSKGIVFIYQPYEIACYAAGHITVLLPWSKVENMIKSEYKQK